MGSFVKRSLVALLLVVLVAQAGCYGGMKLSTKLYSWNGTVGSKFVQSVVFDALVIVQVYTVTTFIDIIILNPIEFWTGSNPVAAAPGIEPVQVGEAPTTGHVAGPPAATH